MQNNQSIINNHSLSAELQLLIACCQVQPDLEEISSQMKNEKLKIKNWENIIALASRHGILPLVYKTLKNLPSALPSDTVSELKARYMSISQRNMLMSAELIRIMKLLEKNGIAAVPFKGPVLSQMVYGDITLRQYADLDILIEKRDIYAMDTLLKAEGFQRSLLLTPSQEKVYIRYAHDMGLYNPKRGISFEMHWSLLDEDYPMQIDLENFREERQSVTINGQEIPVFSNENLLYYLSIHGSKHLWERIEWIKDLDLMVRRQHIAWETVIQKAEGSGFEKMLYLGLHLASSLFGTPLPQTVCEQIARYPELAEVQTFVLESWQEEKSTFAKTGAMLKLFPGMKERVLYLHKIILKPSFNEYWYVDLPKGMYWAYYLVRPYLLLKKYLTRIMH